MFTSRGRGWKGQVGFISSESSPEQLGLEQGERVIGVAALRPGAYLVMGTRGGKVKRTSVADLSLPDRTWDTVMGVGDDDELLFGHIAGDSAHILFYTVQGQLLRIDGDTINPQQTGTATGVVGISLKKGDRLLGGSVVPNAVADENKWQIIVFSQTGYAHRASLAEFSIQGRGARGVRCLRPTKSAGDVGGVAVGQKGTIDVYLADGRRQRLDIKDVPIGARDVRGDRLINADNMPVAQVIYL
jgi:DNA gyrase subunit A